MDEVPIPKISPEHMPMTPRPSSNLEVDPPSKRWKQLLGDE